VTPTVTDADLVLGYLNPEAFIGGRIRLDRAAAEEAIRTQIAEPLGLSLEAAAAGIRQVIDTRMRETVAGLVALRGFALEDYVLLAFGGAGPTHVCGYTEGLPLKAILTFPYAAAFSAFGAAAADYDHHYHRAVNVVLPPDACEDDLAAAGQRLSATWRQLEEQAESQMRKEGVPPEAVRYRHLAMVRYGKQLNDLIVTSPVPRCDTPAEFRRLLAAFEEMYARVYAKGARFPQGGYEIFEVGLVASATKVKPRLAPYPLSDPDPSSARIEVRPAWFGDGFVDTTRYAWPRLQPGNRVEGPAIVEDSTTTLVLPPGRAIRIDEYRTVWIEG